jgi:type III restriction enzyme
VLVTNWQQFRLKEGTASLWEQWTGEDVEEQPRGEIIADFLSEFTDLVVMNDEAHHVHGKKTARNEVLVWRHFMGYLYERLRQKHPKERGLFMQIDYSATPFYGSGANREYFPHIVYDFDLVQAMREPLVKQLFLEERQSIAGERLDDLDFRAIRTEAEGRKRGEIKSLSPGQKLMLDIGRHKLEQLTQEFQERGIDRKPVMVIHTELTEKELTAARLRLDRIDIDEDPLRVVISVLMLREGFDKTNICVTVVLRATEADLLLEQIVGRGLRFMFPEYRYPEFWDAKREAVEDLCRHRMPSNSLDFLFIVEHPRFRAFYDELRQQGYLIGGGDTSKTRTTGDLIPVDAMPARIPAYDVAWPVLIFEQGKLPDLSQIDIASLPKYPTDFEQLKQMLAKLAISDTHIDTGTRAKTWKLDNQYFDLAFSCARLHRLLPPPVREAPF